MQEKIIESEEKDHSSNRGLSNKDYSTKCNREDSGRMIWAEFVMIYNALHRTFTSCAAVSSLLMLCLLCLGKGKEASKKRGRWYACGTRSFFSCALLA